MNTEGATYSGLVSLEVPVEKLCEHVLETKTTRAKQVKRSARPKATVSTSKVITELGCARGMLFVALNLGKLLSAVTETIRLFGQS